MRIKRPFNFRYLKLPKPKVNLLRLTKELYLIEPKGFFILIAAEEIRGQNSCDLCLNAGHPIVVAGSP